MQLKCGLFMDSCTMTGVVQMIVIFWICSDILEECSASVFREMFMAQADAEVSGKNQPTKMPTRTLASLNFPCFT